MFFTEQIPYALHLWHLITRLGDAQVALPLAFAAALMRVLHPETRAQALRWVALLGLAVLVTAASKVAFIGWGVGWAEINFTGISGHAMFAAAVYPLLLSTLASSAPPRTRRFALAVGCAIVILVGVSRVVLGAHSVSEVLAGWLAGGVACLAVLRGTHAPLRIDAAAFLAFGLWLVLVPAAAPDLDTHAAVTRVALRLSGHEHPYTRRAMLRELRRRQDASVINARVLQPQVN